MPRTSPTPPKGDTPSAPIPGGFFSAPFERFVRDETSDWASAFTLLDTMETYFDSRIDLLQRQLQKHSDRLKMRAERFRIRDLSGDSLSENLEKEIKNFKLKLQSRMNRLSASWHSAKVVRTRDKVTFFLGVMSVLVSALLFGMAPDWVHVAYTVLTTIFLPIRAYRYKRRAWHYFLFDLCYYVTMLNLAFIWFIPSNPSLFVACYCLSHGSLASAVITWRNSLVFHDWDKVTSLFIHVYPPFVFSVIRHFYPDAPERFPALESLPQLNPVKALGFSSIIYVIWQLLYWKFILVNRRAKIQSGQRTTSFSWLLNDKNGVIGRTLSAIPEQYREISFMVGQLVYGVLTELPAVYILYDSPFWSGVFLIFIFAVSVWNGGGFYIEVFGRKFERELEALRKELAESSARSGAVTPSTNDMISRSSSEDESSTTAASPLLNGVTLTDFKLPSETSSAWAHSPNKKNQ